MRGDLHRQTKEIFDYHFLADPHAEAQYRAYGAAIDDRLAELVALASNDDERNVVSALERALGDLRLVSETVMARPLGSISASERFALLDTEFETDQLSAVEAALAGAEATFFGAERDLEARVTERTRLAFVVLAVPIGVAILLLLAARGVFQRGFARPLAGLLETMTAYGEGRLDHRAAESGASEMVALQRAIHRMAADLARYREALVQSEKQAALGALVPVIAHNIRNPLAGIRASAQLLETEAARGILGAVDRLNGWLGRPPHVSRPAEGQARRGDAVGLRRPRARDSRGEAGREIDFPSPARAGRRAAARFSTAGSRNKPCAGSVANAVDASPSGGEIVLSVGHEADSCWIAIEDEGPGFRFQPTTNGLEPGLSTKTHGSGLGIPFCAQGLRAS